MCINILTAGRKCFVNVNINIECVIVMTYGGKNEMRIIG